MTEHEPSYRFCVLGPLAVARDGITLTLPGPRPSALLALLLTAPNERWSSDRLIEELWEGAPPPTARSSLQMHVTALRRALGPEAPLRTVPGGYVLDAEVGSVDAQAFERGLAAAREALAADRAQEAHARLREALALWHGEAFGEFAGRLFAHTEAARLEELRLDALELWFEAELALGRHAAELIAELRALVDANPARERLRAHLIVALYRAGRQADALSEFQRARRYLVDELGLEPGEPLRRLQASVLAHDPALEPPAPRKLSRLPAPPTPTVGRAGDLDALQALLDGGERRLTTVLGPGGVGKTRLALEAGRALEGTHRDGVCFVPLAPVAEARDFVYAVALALELPGVAEITEAAVARHLARRDMLLIVDNFEHVLDAAAIVAQLLAEAPSITVLATSRERLRIRPERVFRLAPLSAEPAVALFVDVVRATDPRFAPADGELELVGDLCRRLDGLPLAIELAAGRVGELSVREVASELTAGLAVLAEGPRDAPQRQQTMQAALAWSYDRLGAGEQSAFAALAVFAGGAELTMASEVAGCAQATLVRLADKQLVAVEGSRVGVLETVRAFAAGVLAERDDAATVRDRHAEAMTCFVEQVARDLYETGSADAATLLDRDIDNVRAALAWAIDRADTRRALRLAAAFQEYLWDRAPSEGERWLKAALALPGAERCGREWADALWRFAMIPAWLPSGADLEGAIDAAQRSFAAFAALGDERGCASSRIALTALLFVHGRPDEARVAAREAVAHARAGGDRAVLADALTVTATGVSTFEDGLVAGREARALYEASGNMVRSTMVASNLAYLALDAGEDAVARRLLAEADERVSRVHNRSTVSMLRGNQALLALFDGEHERAAVILRGVVEHAYEQLVHTQLSEAIDLLAAASVMLGRERRGAAAHGAARRLAPAPHLPGIAERLRGGFFGPARERFGAAAWDAAVEEGADLALHEAVALALEPI